MCHSSNYIPKWLLRIKVVIMYHSGVPQWLLHTTVVFTYHSIYYIPQWFGLIPRACKLLACSLVSGNPTIIQPFRTQSNTFSLSSTIFVVSSVGKG